MKVIDTHYANDDAQYCHSTTAEFDHSEAQTIRVALRYWADIGGDAFANKLYAEMIEQGF